MTIICIIRKFPQRKKGKVSVLLENWENDACLALTAE
jgi:hypothetical protein